MPISPENRLRYPSNWAEISRYIRHERAGNKCEWCFAENHQPHPITGSKVVLTCAHIHDHRPEACDLGNLAALCQKCHNTHDAKHRAETRKKRSGGGQIVCQPTASQTTPRGRTFIAQLPSISPRPITG